MVIVDKLQELNNKLKVFETQRSQLDAKIQETPRVSKGALNFGYYQLNKKRAQITNNILKINSVIKPDIIA